MVTGDRVRLHIDPGRSAVLDLPESVGTVQAIDVDSEQMALLVHFDRMSVYVSPISPEEVEVIDRDTLKSSTTPR